MTMSFARLGFFKSTKVRLWITALALALGLWSRFVYLDMAEFYDSDGPTAQEIMASSSEWRGIGQYIFLKAVPFEMAIQIIKSIERWRAASELLLFLAGLLILWLAIDIIAPVLDRLKSQRE
jgi:hypothetical protein